jgi:hypothetical protein
MKRFSIWLTIGMLGLGFSVIGCDEEGEDEGVDGPPWSCHFDTNMPGQMLKGCFQYDDEVTEEEADTACDDHRISGQIHMVENPKLKGGPCDLDRVSGYCVVPVASGDIPGPPLPGKEWIQYKDEFLEDPILDCRLDGDEIGSVTGCEVMSGGVYTCTVTE